MRKALLALVAALAVIASAPAVARVDFGDRSQNAFGVNPTGVRIEGAGVEPFSEAWDLFRGTIEGGRILGRLDGRLDWEITVEVLPANQVERGDDIHGRAIVKGAANAEGRRTARVIIIDNPSRSPAEIAETIYHEFRHVEHWMDGDYDDGHDHLHDGSGEGITRFLDQLTEAVTGEAPRPSLPPARTPIYDAIMTEAANRDDFLRQSAVPSSLHRIFDEIGEALDSIEARRRQAVYLDSTDIDVYSLNRGAFSDAGVAVDFNDSVFECGETTPIRAVVCADEVLPMPAGDVFVAGMTLVGDVPLADPDRSYIYSLVLDSDGDAANNWVFNPPFDWDLFQGTDRWYQLIWDHRARSWSLTVTQLGPAGRFPSSTEPSTMRAVIEGNAIAFFVSMDEFSSPSPGVRLTAFHHDGNFSEETRGADVSGPDPTAPLDFAPDDPIDFGW